MAALVRDPDTVLSVRNAAEENSIPYSFARSIQHDLAEAGIIASTRGAHGGMSLAVDPETVTLLDIVQAVQGPKPFCPFNPIWCGAQTLLEAYLSSFSLKEAALGADPAKTRELVSDLNAFMEKRAAEKKDAASDEAE